MREPLFVNYYKCERCVRSWDDRWSALHIADRASCGPRGEWVREKEEGKMTKTVEDLVIASECVNPRFTVLVRPYAFGQFRIQICDRAQPDPHAPYGCGSIVRELCTYRRETCSRVVFDISQSVDPPATARTYEQPWNCEGKGDRIRLDNER